MEPRPAKKWKRLIAAIIDWSLLIIYVIGGGLFVFFASERARGSNESNNWLFLLIILAIPLLVHQIFEATTGRTLGKVFTETVVRKADGEKAGVLQLLGRMLVRTLFILSVLPLLSILFSKDGRGWHDKLSRTMVTNHTAEEISGARVPIWRRFLSFAIDTPVALLSGLVLGMFLAMQSMNLNEQWVLIGGIVIGYLLYYIILEMVGCRTLGKWVTGTAVRTPDGTRPDFKAIVARSLFRLVPFEPFSVFLSRKSAHEEDDEFSSAEQLEAGEQPSSWWHDKWSGTKVIIVEERLWLTNRWREFSLLFSPKPWIRGSLIYEFFLYPGLWIPLLLINWVIIYWAGRKFGAPLLFWHDDWLTALFAGFATAMAIAWGLLLFLSLDYTKWLNRRFEIKQWLLERDIDLDRFRQDKKSIRDYLPTGNHWTNRLYAYYRNRHGTPYDMDGEVMDVIALRSYFFRSLVICASLLIGALFLIRLILVVVEMLTSTDASWAWSEGEILQRQIEVLGSNLESVRFWTPSWWAFPGGFLAGILFILIVDVLKLRLKWARKFIIRVVEGKAESVVKPSHELEAIAWEAKREKRIMWVMVIYGVTIVLATHLTVWIIGESFNHYYAAPALCIMAGWIMLLYFVIGLLLRRLQNFAFFVVAVVAVAFIAGSLFSRNHRYEYVNLSEGGNYEPIRKTDFITLEEAERIALKKSQVRPEPAAVNEVGLIYRDPTGKRPSDKPRKAEWRERTKKSENTLQEDPLIIICASGGGITAEVWAVRVLSLLSDKLNGFNDNVRIVTGASGGMVGASAWVVDQYHKNENQEIQHSRGDLISRSERDQLSAAAHRWALWDMTAIGLVQRNSKLRHTDRGNVLERSWTRGNWAIDKEGNEYKTAILPELNTTLGHLVNKEIKGECPSLIFAPMIAEDGRQLLISNLELSKLTRISEETPFDKEELFRDQILAAKEAALVFGPERTRNQPISSWARMSATFPIVTPAGALDVLEKNPEGNGGGIPNSRVIHLVDAGYSDNYGTATAIAWLREYWLPWVKKKGQDAPRKVILIELDAYPRYGGDAWAFPKPSLKRLAENVSKLDDRMGRVIGEVQGPKSSVGDVLWEDVASVLSGATNRNKSSVLRSEQMVEQFAQTLAELREASGEDEYLSGLDFRSFRLTNPINASLSWALSDSEKKLLSSLSEKMRDFLEEPTLSDEFFDYLFTQKADSEGAANTLFTFQQLCELKIFWNKLQGTDFDYTRFLQPDSWFDWYARRSQRKLYSVPLVKEKPFRTLGIHFEWVAPSKEDKNGYWEASSGVTHGQWYDVTGRKHRLIGPEDKPSTVMTTFMNHDAKREGMEKRISILAVNRFCTSLTELHRTRLPNGYRFTADTSHWDLTSEFRPKLRISGLLNQPLLQSTQEN